MKKPTIYDTAIIGGGIAGCSAAIHLAKRGHQVLLLEKKRYPVQKLCGEFLSVEASGYLQKLGVLDVVGQAGAARISQMKLISKSGHYASAHLPGAAIGISRFVLDKALINRAADAGAECTENVHVKNVTGTLGDFKIESADGAIFRANSVIMAFGKRSTLAESANPKQKLVAFKTHFEGPFAADSIEMYGFDGGYVGISPIENGLVNACFIATNKALKASDGTVEGFVDSARRQNQGLDSRLAPLKPVGKFIGISNFSFAVHGPVSDDKLMIGDAAAMIAPLCGDGMSMAMRSAEIAAEKLDSYLRGQSDARQLKRAYASAWKREFLLRLRVGQVLQEVAQNSAVADLAVKACCAAPKIAEHLIKVTRGRSVISTVRRSDWSGENT